MFFRIPLFALLFNQLVLHAYCRRNVTVDDNDSQIQYSGDWGRSTETDLNYGRSHVLTSNPTSFATFNFTGVAVYFLSPLWPYPVSTALTLDSRPTLTVDLTDYSIPDTGGGPESIGPLVVWSAENLSNTTHSLRISVGRAQQFAIVDGITYTILEPGDSTSSSTSSTTSSSDNSRQAVLIALGTVLGVLALIVIVLILFICLRRRNKPTNGSTRSTRRYSLHDNKWPNDAASVATSPVAGQPSGVPHSSPIPPLPSIVRSRPESQPGEPAWSTSSVGGPGVPNMTGIGTSANNSRILSYHPADSAQNIPGFLAPSQNVHDAGYLSANGPYGNPNQSQDGRSGRYPAI